MFKTNHIIPKQKPKPKEENLKTVAETKTIML